MHPYVLSLKKLYEQNANPAQAVADEEIHA